MSYCALFGTMLQKIPEVVTLSIPVRALASAIVCGAQVLAAAWVVTRVVAIRWAREDDPPRLWVAAVVIMVPGLASLCYATRSALGKHWQFRVRVGRHRVSLGPWSASVRAAIAGWWTDWRSLGEVIAHKGPGHEDDWCHDDRLRDRLTAGGAEPREPWPPLNQRTP